MDSNEIIEKTIKRLEKKVEKEETKTPRERNNIKIDDINESIKELKSLQHHKDTTIGLYAFDKNIEDIFENIPDTSGCKTAVEAYLVQQVDYLKSIIFRIE